MEERYNTARKWLLFWTLFIGIGAVAGSIGMISDPTGKSMGMDAMLPYFQVLPFSEILFQNLTFSGFALLIVNGITNLCASVFLIMKKRIGIILGGIFGITLMLWICIQFYMFPLNFMSTIYFVFGIIQALTGYITFVFYNQKQYYFNEKDYKNICKSNKQLVVYYSRNNYTKKIAFQEANKIGADLFEITANEKTSGFFGFLWCGRLGMHKWSMNINAIPENIFDYEHIIICTPIWVFSISSPIRSFCIQAKNRIVSADLITVHFTKGKYKNALKEVEELLNIKIKNYKTICCRFGMFR